MKTAIVIQARVNSTRIEKKMCLKINGKCNLLVHLLLKMHGMEDVFLSATAGDAEEMLRDAQNLTNDITIHHRSESSVAQDASDPLVVFDWLDKLIGLGYDSVVMVSACSPFLKKETIKDFVENWNNSKDNHDSMFSFIKKKNLIMNGSGGLLVYQDTTDTKSMMPYYELSHTLYASKLQSIKDGYWTHNLADSMKIYEIDEPEAFDIDDKWQFDLASSYFKNFNDKLELYDSFHAY